MTVAPRTWDPREIGAASDFDWPDPLPPTASGSGRAPVDPPSVLQPWQMPRAAKNALVELAAEVRAVADPTSATYGDVPANRVEIIRFGRDVIRERARFALDDAGDERDAPAPLSQGRARWILQTRAEEDAARTRPTTWRPLPTDRPDPRELIRRLGVDPDRGHGATRCPAHEDRSPSLSWRLMPDKVLLHCHAGCSFDAILAAIA